MEYIAEITLDVALPTAFRYIRAKQDDTGSRFVKATIAKNGDVIAVPPSITAYLRAGKPDGSGIYNLATVNADGTVTMELTAQTLAVPGEVYADLELREGNVILATASFTIQVDPNPLGDVSIESTSEFQALTALIEQADELIAQVSAEADRAEAAAETFTTDPTLSIAGKAADAAATGSAIKTLNNNLLATTSNLDALINQTTRGHQTHFFLSSATGAPGTTWNGYVETLVESTGYAAQWAYLGSGNIYTRTRSNTTISDWVPIYRNQSVSVTDVNVNSKSIQSRMIGPVCFVSGWVRPKAQSYTAVSTALVKLSVVPAARTFFPAFGGDTTYGMELTAAGNIVFNSSSPTFSGNPYIFFNFTFIVG